MEEKGGRGGKGRAPGGWLQPLPPHQGLGWLGWVRLLPGASVGLRRPVEERPLRAAGCPAGGSRGCRGVLGTGMGRDGTPRSPPAVSGMLGWGKFPQYWDKGEGRDAPGAAAIAAPCLGCRLFHVRLISERNLAWTRSLAHQGGWVVPQPSPQRWSLPSPQPPATIPLPCSPEGHPQRGGTKRCWVSGQPSSTPGTRP